MIKFTELGLSENITKALEDLGFTSPTPIQEKCIPKLLASDNDLIGLAQTGTGKTAGFSLPIIEKLDKKARHVQAIILCPTRELCLQITKDISTFTKYLPEISVTPIYGGAGMMKQMDDLRRGTQIVVGTPGRVHDLIRRKVLKINDIKWLVLDEADEMLNMGFKEELDAILAETPSTKQTILFSATMPSMMRSIASKYMKNPIEVKAGEANISADKIEHIFYMVHAQDRYQALRRIADVNPDIYGIVFCRTKRETQEVAEKLIQDHYSAEAIHGDLSQGQRTETMNRFRKKQTQLLIATDVAARGIDVKELTHVINYNLPDQLETYIHRSGRTGRAASKGISIVIIHMKEKGKIGMLERKIGKYFTQGMIPSGKEICEKQLLHFIDKIKKIEVNENQINDYLPVIKEKFADLSREDLINHLVAIEFNRFLEMYKNAPDINVHRQSSMGRDRMDSRDRGPRMDSRDRGPRMDSRDRGPRSEGRDRPNLNIKFMTFTLNLGRKDNFTKKDFFNLINRNQQLKGIEIGRIEIKDHHSQFEADMTEKNNVVFGLSKCRFQGKQVQANIVLN